MDQLAIGHLGSHLGVLRNAEDARDEVDQPGGVIDDDERIEYRAAGGNRWLGKQNLTVHTGSLAAGRTVSGCQADGFASGSAAVSRHRTRPNERQDAWPGT
jgi:hypothetical protein